jgi:hypothetical protein
LGGEDATKDGESEQNHRQERGDGSWDRPKGTVDLENAPFMWYNQACIYARATGARAANFQGRHIKKKRLKYGMRKKRLSTREKFKGDLY